MIRFGILGPLRVDRDGSAVPFLGAQLLRRLLAALLCRPGELVPTDDLISALWGNDAPPSARKTLQVYVRRLRAALGEEHRIVHQAPGYRINVCTDELDQLKFAELIAEAHSNDRLERAAELYQQALDLWRGPAFEDVREHRPVDDEARRLDEERLRAETALVEIQLELGRHDQAISQLKILTEVHPFREDLLGHLMLAFYRAGRQTEALEAYQTVRALLANELGISPGNALQRLHESILRSSPDLDLAPRNGYPVPRELPAEIGGFVGRSEQLHALDALLPAASPVVISAIAGTAGVGKTALAVQWARRIVSRFPDGQLYLNLNGFSASAPTRPIEALSSMLRALGVPSEKVPHAEVEAAALFRSTVADRRLLILLDNAGSAAQVRPLLPGNSGCLVVVTSRNKLSGLVAKEGARRLSLDVLSPGEARELIARIIGEDRVEAEPAAVDELARICAYLPLALRIAAANLNDQPHRTVAMHLGELSTGDRLASLAVAEDEENAVRIAFELSYQDIAEHLRSTFRMLGLVPGRDFTFEAVAALTGLSAIEAEQHLIRLSNAHLLEQVGRDRYSFHDLLRLYAQDRLSIEDSAADRVAAADRLYDWYIRTVDAAAEFLHPVFLRLSPPGDTGASASPVPFAEPAEAAQWLDAERRNLTAAIHHTAECGPAEVAWGLASGMRGYFAQRRHLSEWLPAAQVAMRAASEHGDSRSQGAAHLLLAHAYQTRYDIPAAMTHLRMAADFGRNASWPVLQATCLGNLAGLLYDAGSVDEATDVLERSLELNREVGHAIGEAQALSNLGLLKLRMGQLADAVNLLDGSVNLPHGLAGGPQMLAMCNLAEAHRQLGHLGTAGSLLAAAVSAAEEAGTSIAPPLLVRARICLDVLRFDEAMVQAMRAQQAATSVGHRLFEAEALVVIGLSHVAKLEYEAGFGCMEAAKGAASAASARYTRTRASINGAAIQHRLGDHVQAFVEGTQALEEARKYSYGVLVGQVSALLGKIEFDRGNRLDGFAFATAGLASYRKTGCRLGEAEVLTLLALHETDAAVAAALHSEGARLYAAVRESAETPSW